MDTRAVSPFKCREVLLSEQCTATSMTPIHDVDKDGRAEAVVGYECPSYRAMSLTTGKAGPEPCTIQGIVLTHNAAHDKLSTRRASLTLPNGVVLKPLQSIRIEGEHYLVSTLRVQSYPARIEIELTKNHPPIFMERRWEAWKIATLTITGSSFTLVAKEVTPGESRIVRELQGEVRNLKLRIVP